MSRFDKAKGKAALAVGHFVMCEDRGGTVGSAPRACYLHAWLLLLSL